MPVNSRQTGTIVAVCTSPTVGTAKQVRDEVQFIPNQGLSGDGHAGTIRQVSILMGESVDAFNQVSGLFAGPGDFAENLVTKGVTLDQLPVGTQLRIGSGVLEITQIGKEILPHHYSFHGHRLLPSEGVFCRVIGGGTVKPGDPISIAGDETPPGSDLPCSADSRWEIARNRWRQTPRSAGLFKGFTEPWFDPGKWHFDATGALEGTFVGAACHEGYSGIVHGGVLAALADAVMTHCLFGHDVAAFTVELKMTFRKPLVIGQEARVRAVVRDQINRQIFHLHTTFIQDEILRAEALGTFFRPVESNSVSEQPHKPR